MSKPHRQRKDDPEQSRLFVEAAKLHGADTDDMPAEELLQRMATKPPKPHKG